MSDVAVAGSNGSTAPTPVEAPVDPRLELVRSMSIGKQAALYRALRDRIKAKEKAFEASLQVEKKLMAQMEGLFQQQLDAVGGKRPSIKTEYGTVHFTTRWSTSVTDKEGFMSYVIDNQAWELLDRRANVTATRSFAGKHKQAPPGVTLTAMQKVRVRKPGAQPGDDDDADDEE